MAIVKALRRLASGGFGLIGASDQIACDAGAMTVTPTGGAQQTVPEAIGRRVLADANGRAPATRVAIGTMADNLCINGDMEETFGDQCAGWGINGSQGAVVVRKYPDYQYEGKMSLLLDKGAAGAGSNYVIAYYFNEPMRVLGDAAYEAECFVRAIDQASPAGFYFRINWFDEASNYLSFSDAASDVPMPPTWVRQAKQVRSPINARIATIGLYNFVSSTARYVAVDAVSFRRVRGSTAIEDTAVTPAKLYAPTRGQFFRALENSGAGRVAAIADAVPSDRNDAINIAFGHATFVTGAGTLAQFVKTTLALSDAQLAAIITAARSVAE